MSKIMDIEVAAPSERTAVLSVIKAAYKEYEERSDKNFWNGYQQSIEQTVLTDDSVTLIVAKSDDTIYGAVIYCQPYEKRMANAIVKNPFPEMRLLAVPAEHRNHGVAAKLIEYCEDKARSSGSPTITLHTTVLMQTAKQMYERRGYLRYPDIDFTPAPGFVVWGFRKDFATE
ncbi:MAG TPA: GNAT family N-acetyltransferase [Trichormus sp.]